MLRQYGFTKLWNLAEQHAKLITTLGYTPPWLNDLIIENTTTEQHVAAALNKPQIQVTQKGDQLFEAVVTGVPTNHAGYRMKLPMPPPWEALGKRGQMLALVGEKDAEKYADPNAQVRVRVIGIPNDETLERKIEEHEQVHAKDIMRVIDQVLVPWDAKLTAAMKEQTKFQGATAQAAEKAVYDAVGGTPDEIANILYTRWDQDSKAFHQHPKGKTVPVLDKSGSNESATQVWIAYRLTV